MYHLKEKPRYKALPFIVDEFPKNRFEARNAAQKKVTSSRPAYFHKVHALTKSYSNLLVTLLPSQDIRKPAVAPEIELKKSAIFPSAVHIFKVNSSDEDEEILEETEQEHSTDPVSCGFWLTVFINSKRLAPFVKSYDMPILNCLKDVAIRIADNSVGFTIIFRFASNDYFTNAILTKDYEMKDDQDNTKPFDFVKEKFIGCKGCVINWKDGKNVTYRKLQKRRRQNGNGANRMKSVEVESFFNFFSPPERMALGDQLFKDKICELQKDFDFGCFIAQDIIPKAMQYYFKEIE